MKVTCKASAALLGLAIAGCQSPSEPSPPSTLPPSIVVPPPAPVPPAPVGTAVFVPAPVDAGTTPFAGPSPVGLYRLEITLGDTTDPDCPFLPDEARTRAYAAAVTFSLPLGLRVKVGEATFLESASCDHPSVGPGDGICHWFRYEYDDFRDGHLWLGTRPTRFVERLSDGSWLELRGSSYGPETPTGVVGTGALTALHWSGGPAGTVFRECFAPFARTTLTRN